MTDRLQSKHGYVSPQSRNPVLDTCDLQTICKVENADDVLVANGFGQRDHAKVRGLKES